MLPADLSTLPSIFEPQIAEAEEPGFDNLGLSRKLVRALSIQGIHTPFPIQVATIPDALAGRDVLGRGRTGSGKTLAFGLPMLTRLAASGRATPHHPKALVLVPTRELAMQVNDALTPLAKVLGLFCKTAVGGVPYDRQIWSLERGVDVLVATPGRLGDLIKRGVANLSAVEITVLDEADQMADMGFLPEVTELLDMTPKGSQRLLFSATLDKDVDALVERFLTDPVEHSIEPAVASIDEMDHHVLLVPPNDKYDIAAAIANRSGRTILFVKTQLAVDELVAQFASVGVRAGALHGGKTQRVRTRTLAEFREGTVNVLVATDVAARGIHVDDVSLVVHVDLPRDQKDYLHRDRGHARPAAPAQPGGRDAGQGRREADRVARPGRRSQADRGDRRPPTERRARAATAIRRRQEAPAPAPRLREEPATGQGRTQEPFPAAPPPGEHRRRKAVTSKP